MLKFPPVEDVHILISMGLNYQQKMPDRNSKHVRNVSAPINTPTIPVVTPTPGPLISNPISGPLQVPTRPAPMIMGNSVNILINPLQNKSPIRTIEKTQETKIGQDKSPLRPPENKKKELFSNPLMSKPPEKIVKSNNNSGFPLLGPEKIHEKFMKNTSPKSSSPLQFKKEEVKSEENKVNFMKNENSSIEKCNQALLLLLEQSDE